MQHIEIAYVELEINDINEYQKKR